MWYLNHGSRGSLCLPAVGLWRAAMRQSLPQAAAVSAASSGKRRAGRVGGERGKQWWDHGAGTGLGMGSRMRRPTLKKVCCGIRKEGQLLGKSSQQHVLLTRTPSSLGPDGATSAVAAPVLGECSAVVPRLRQLDERALWAGGKSRQEQARAGTACRQCLQAL